MTPTRLRAKGRRGGEIEGFTFIPDHVMRSPALATANHASFRVLAILVVGKPKERNGTMACTDSYSARYGVHSHETVYRALGELKHRGLIVVTRQGLRMRKIPTLWAVTWWPVFYREGKPLDRPEEPTFDYQQWQPITPTVGVEIESHTDSRGDVTPTNGVGPISLHPDLAGHTGLIHPDHRGYSKTLGVGGLTGRGDKVRRLMDLQPHLVDRDIAVITNEPIEFVQRIRQSISQKLG
jgi:hypothetical protein